MQEHLHREHGPHENRPREHGSHEHGPHENRHRVTLSVAFAAGVAVTVLGFALGLLMTRAPHASAQEKVEQTGGDLRFPPELIWENRNMKADAVSISVSPNGKELYVAVIDPVEGLRVVHLPTSRVR
ncbi:MAG: hypothetical protein AAF560_09850 [Acidobacteriota bacterium]